MHAVVALCRPLPSVRYVAFHSFMQAEYAPDSYYEVLTLDEVLDLQTILAYEMNWEPLPLEHGAPCRLRIETKTGYNMVKYLTAVEFIDAELGGDMAGTGRITSFMTRWPRSSARIVWKLCPSRGQDVPRNSCHEVNNAP